MGKCFNFNEPCELKAAYKPKKANSRKSNANIFIYRILQKHSDKQRPMKQKDILSKLADMPYEIVIERKALSRTLHSLEELGIGVHIGADGAYYEDDFVA